MPSLDLNDLPLRARWLILVVVGIGVTTVAVAIPDVAMWNRADLLACVALAAGIVGTEQFPIRLRYRTESINFSLTEALWVIGLLQARPSVLTVSVAAGLLTSQLVRRRRAFKIGFNVGQFLVALFVAQLVRGTMGEATALVPRGWMVAGLAMAAYAAVNATLVAAIISLVEKRPFLSVFVPPLKVNALHFAGNTALGLEGAVMWMASPFLLPTFVVPLALALFAYRVLVRNVKEGEHVRDLIVEYASDGIFVSDPNDRILSWNPAMERITGYSAEEVSLPHQPQPYGDLFAVRVDGSGLLRLTHNGFEEGTPAWGPAANLKPSAEGRKTLAVRRLPSRGGFVFEARPWPISS